MTNLFLTLTEVQSNRKVRINSNSLVSYCNHISVFQDNEIGPCTALYINHEEMAALLVQETPEQIDAILAHNLVTVYHES